MNYDKRSFGGRYGRLAMGWDRCPAAGPVPGARPVSGHPVQPRAAAKASSARSTSSAEWAADSWTRMRAWPCGTTG